MSRFGRRSTALDVVRHLDLSGTIVAITDATSRVGAEVARALASAGAELILPVRDLELGSAIADTLITDTGNAKIRNYKLDLADFDSVRRFADNVMNDYPRVDILINNAELVANPFQHCSQGYELHFAVNHLSHFLLTAFLAEALASSPASRVICLSSAAHRLSPVMFDDIHFTQRPYDKWLAYGQSKTANALFAKALNERLQHHGGLALAVNPGIVIGKQRHLAQEGITSLRWVDGKANPRQALKTPGQSAAICAWAATASEAWRLAGHYCEDFKIAEAASADNLNQGIAAHACDPEAASQLWDLSEHLVDCQFRFPPRLNPAAPRPDNTQGISLC